MLARTYYTLISHAFLSATLHSLYINNHAYFCKCLFYINFSILKYITNNSSSFSLFFLHVYMRRPLVVTLWEYNNPVVKTCSPVLESWILAIAFKPGHPRVHLNGKSSYSNSNWFWQNQRPLPSGWVKCVEFPPRKTIGSATDCFKIF